MRPGLDPPTQPPAPALPAAGRIYHPTRCAPGHAGSAGPRPVPAGVRPHRDPEPRRSGAIAAASADYLAFLLNCQRPDVELRHSRYRLPGMFRPADARTRQHRHSPAGPGSGGESSTESTVYSRSRHTNLVGLPLTSQTSTGSDRTPFTRAPMFLRSRAKDGTHVTRSSRSHGAPSPVGRPGEDRQHHFIRKYIRATRKARGKSGKWRSGTSRLPPGRRCPQARDRAGCLKARARNQASGSWPTGP